MRPAGARSRAQQRNGAATTRHDHVPVGGLRPPPCFETARPARGPTIRVPVTPPQRRVTTVHQSEAFGLLHALRPPARAAAQPSEYPSQWRGGPVTVAVGLL